MILTSILMGIRGVIYGLSLHICFTSIVAFGLYYGWFPNLGVNLYSTMDWLTIAINSLVVCSITSIPLSILIKGLGDYIKKHNVLEKVLKEKIIQLNSAKNEAEKANDLKTKFLANMSHEVRTPLNVIMGFSEIVQNGMYNDKAERNQFLRTISINGHYLLNVIENILDISMIESNQFKYSIHEVGVLSIINELKEVYQLKKQIWR